MCNVDQSSWAKLNGKSKKWINQNLMLIHRRAKCGIRQILLVELGSDVMDLQFIRSSDRGEPYGDYGLVVANSQLFLVQCENAEDCNYRTTFFLAELVSLDEVNIRNDDARYVWHSIEKLEKLWQRSAKKYDHPSDPFDNLGWLEPIRQILGNRCSS